MPMTNSNDSQFESPMLKGDKGDKPRTEKGSGGQLESPMEASQTNGEKNGHTND
jgi:hypothetical protein